MRFLLDESADLPLAHTLRAQGHDVTSIVRDHPRSLPDREVLALAHAEQRILITNDKDFGELIIREGFPHAGVILFRLREESIPIKRAWLERVLSQHADRLDQFLVVTERGVRTRRPASGS